MVNPKMAKAKWRSQKGKGNAIRTTPFAERFRFTMISPLLFPVKYDKFPQIRSAGAEVWQGRELEAQCRWVGTALDIERTVKICPVNDKLAVEYVVASVLACYIHNDLQCFAVVIRVVGDLSAIHFRIVEGDDFRFIFDIAGEEGNFVVLRVVREGAAFARSLACLHEFPALREAGVRAVLDVDRADFISGCADGCFLRNAFVCVYGDRVGEADAVTAVFDVRAEGSGKSAAGEHTIGTFSGHFLVFLEGSDRSPSFSGNVNFFFLVGQRKVA